MPLINIIPRTNQCKRDETCYECPLYRTAERHGQLTTTGHSTNFVMYTDLPTGSYDKNHWCKRGVAMLCEIED